MIYRKTTRSVLEVLAKTSGKAEWMDWSSALDANIVQRVNSCYKIKIDSRDFRSRF